MIELPRAALTAGEIAEDGEFFSLRHQRPDADHAGRQPRRCRRASSATYVEKGIYAARPVRQPRRRGRRRAGRDRGRAGPGDAARHQARHLRRAWRRPGVASPSASRSGSITSRASPYRVPIARLAAAQAALAKQVRLAYHPSDRRPGEGRVQLDAERREDRPQLERRLGPGLAGSAIACRPPRCAARASCSRVAGARRAAAAYAPAA